jgi:hypothetical protein
VLTSYAVWLLVAKWANIAVSRLSVVCQQRPNQQGDGGSQRIPAASFFDCGWGALAAARPRAAAGTLLGSISPQQAKMRACSSLLRPAMRWRER